MALLNKPSAAANPRLSRAWAEYGHMVAWDDLVACRFRSDGGYVLLAWRSQEGELEYADMAWDGCAWQMQNDSSDPIADADFVRIHIPAGCDWHLRPGEEGWRR